MHMYFRLASFALLLAAPLAVANPIIQKVANVEGEVTITPDHDQFKLTFTHKDLGRATDCSGVLTTDITLGEKGREVRDIPFGFANISPDKNHAMTFGTQVLKEVRAAHTDVDPFLIVFANPSDVHAIKSLYCFFGPPADTKIILKNRKKQVKVYVENAAIHLLFDNAKKTPYQHDRCTFAISAGVTASDKPDLPVTFKMAIDGIRPIGLSLASGGTEALKKRRGVEFNDKINFDPSRVKVLNHYCWAGGESQLTTTYASDFLITPDGKEAVWYSPRKESGVLADIASAIDGPSLDTRARGIWRTLAFSKDKSQFAVSKPGKVSVYETASMAELRVLDVADTRGPLSMGQNLLVVGKTVIDSTTGEVRHTFAEPLRSHDFSADGKQLIVSYDRADSPVHVIPVGTWKTAKSHTAVTKPSQIVALDSSYWVSSGTEIHEVSLADGKIEETYNLKKEVQDFALSGDGRVLAALSENLITLRDMGSRGTYGEKGCGPLAKIPVSGIGSKIEISPNGSLYVVGIKRRLLRKNLVDFWSLAAPKQGARGCLTMTSVVHHGGAR